MSESTNNILISNAIYKLYISICKAKINKVNPTNIKELEILKTKCEQTNLQISLVACNTFVKLCEDGILDISPTLTMFMSILPNSAQITSVAEGIFGLLLLEMKRENQKLKNGKYLCPFSIVPPQHPLIPLILLKGRNINVLVTKINGICNHHDKQIAKNSIEFLRPVYLFVLSNPSIIPDSKTLWTSLLLQTDNSNNGAMELVYEILSWSRTQNYSCLNTNILLSEAIEYMYIKKNTDFLSDMIVFLVSMLKDLCLNGYNPIPSLNLIMKILNELQSKKCYFYNIILILFAEILHVIPVIYVTELVRVLMFIIITENSGNLASLYMIVDALIQLIAYPSFSSKEFLEDVQYLIMYIKSNKYKLNPRNKQTYLYNSKTKYFLPEIALAYDLCLLSESEYCFEKFSILLQNNSKLEFCTKIHLFLRALFLSNELDDIAWKNIYQILLNVVEINDNIATGFLITVLYKLANEFNPFAQKILLQGIVKFGNAKENLPIILNTLSRLSQTKLQDFCLDLYLRLWKIHPRTYPFLYNQLLDSNNTEKSWEHDILKAYTIREICFINPSYGEDLIIQLSNILNRSDDVAISLTVEAIAKLCENNTVNIVSTWNVINIKFKNEKRIKVIKSLCKLFEKVPELKSSTPQYENLLDEIIEKLWHYVIYFDNEIVISSALKALKNFNLECMTFKHLPDIFRPNNKIRSSLAKNAKAGLDEETIELVTYIPGECWIQVLRNVNHCAIESAADLVSHHIYNEIQEYRGGVYLLLEGRPEPLDLKSLPQKSVLSAVISYVISQSKSKELENELIVTSCLRILSKKYTKPIPPLNWSFLYEYFHRSFEMRKYCVIIAINQMCCSGSAKRLIENYLLQFDPINIEDLLVLFGELENLSSGGVDIQIFKTFFNNSIEHCYKISKKDSFENDCLFVKTLNSIKKVLPIIKIDEILLIYTDVIAKYLDIVNLNDNIFSNILDLICVLPLESVEQLLSANSLWDASSEKIRKITLIRCNLIEKDNKKMVNPLNWINPLIDLEAINDDENFMLHSIGKSLYYFSNSKLACDWTIELLGQIQSILADRSNKHIKAHFLCDVFIVAISMFSGTGSLYCNLETIVNSKQIRLDLFPQSLHLLCERDYWKDNEIKIYELLYHMFINPNIPKHLQDTFKFSLIASKNHNYFEQKSIWTKYVCLRK